MAKKKVFNLKNPNLLLVAQMKKVVTVVMTIEIGSKPDLGGGEGGRILVVAMVAGSWRWWWRRCHVDLVERYLGGNGIFQVHFHKVAYSSNTRVWIFFVDQVCCKC